MRSARGSCATGEKWDVTYVTYHFVTYVTSCATGEKWDVSPAAAPCGSCIRYIRYIRYILRSVRQASRGGSRYIGRHVPRMAREAGFGRVQMEAVLAASDELPEGARGFEAHLDPARYRQLVQLGLLAESEYARLVDQMHTFTREPSAVVMSVNLLVLGSKSEEGASEAEGGASHQRTAS
jgi:hypothetical protein